ncbi:uncharacterized protein SAPINGB_P004168 [Magnusiomyces paraingens]|uniref:Uncharacterized protein n=1 Tax=Magnusiomyces paraingens TaxID=2606893 RepID=A0A5E8BT37_9ASCO|nr:uncharacterized protein SAPINGB_P004167 [Saprochaete ingens]XP_031854774.1 uncharacterized protein SAPINGB_P004168 [Saprochaete ingens]VVT54621.1 unnamed protein product [Saprochaete ingens]VVT54623.1 unnamed protein product [Saprochaete ingens]
MLQSSFNNHAILSTPKLYRHPLPSLILLLLQSCFDNHAILSTPKLYSHGSPQKVHLSAPQSKQLYTSIVNDHAFIIADTCWIN